MRQHERFEWNADKAHTNVRKHRVMFEDAAAMLSDPGYALFHVEEFDMDHSDDEDRYRTFGTDPLDRSIVLVVTWTERDNITRIISARRVTVTEQKTYEAEIAVRQNDP